MIVDFREHREKDQEGVCMGWGIPMAGMGKKCGQRILVMGAPGWLCRLSAPLLVSTYFFPEVLGFSHIMRLNTLSGAVHFYNSRF